MNYFKISKYLLFLPLLLGTVLVTRSTLFPFIVGKYVFLRVSVGLSLLLFLLGLLFQTDRGKFLLSRLAKIAKSPVFIAISAFVLMFLLAGFFGVDPLNSFWSNFERGEGGLQMITFFVYFTLLLTLFEKKEDWHKLLGFAIAGGILMGVYGFLAAYGVNGFVGAKFSDGGFRFQGSIGNPAYVAVYSLFLIFYCLYLFLQERGKQIFSARNMWFLILIVFFASIFLLAATRGAFLGFGTALIVALSYIGFSYKKFRLKVISLVILLILVVSSLIFFKDAPLVKSIPGSRVFDISYTAQTFQHRMIMWKVAWDGFVERPVLGWGPENYLKVFDSHFNIKYYNPPESFGSWFDRAHSVVFDYLVETGALGLLAYLSIFVLFYVMFFKSPKREGRRTVHDVLEKGLFFAIPVAYLVQGLVLFDVSITYLNLFTVLAFSIFKFWPLENPKDTLRISEKKH